MVAQGTRSCSCSCIHWKYGCSAVYTSCILADTTAQCSRIMCVYMYVHTHIDTQYTLVLLVLEYLYSSCTTAAVLQQLYYSCTRAAAVHLQKVRVCTRPAVYAYTGTAVVLYEGNRKQGRRSLPRYINPDRQIFDNLGFSDNPDLQDSISRNHPYTISDTSSFCIEK